MSEVSNMLEQRAQTYGPYKFQAVISQGIKDAIHKAPGFARMSPYMQESLEMIANKIGRILNGDPTYADSWVDIAGYAQLVVNELEGKGK